MSFDSSDLSLLRSNYMEMNNLMNQRTQLTKSKRADGHKINVIDAKLQDLYASTKELLKKGEINTNDPSTVWVSQLKERIKSLQPKMPESTSNELKQGLENVKRKTMDIRNTQMPSSSESAEGSEEELPPPPSRSIETPPKK